MVNGKPYTKVDNDGFVYFKIDDEVLNIDLELDMNAKYMVASNRVKADFGKVAVQRGPLVYAAEEVDNQKPLWTAKILTDQKSTLQYEPDLLNGVVTISVPVEREELAGINDALYQPLPTEIPTTKTELKMIPYYAWANRENGTMQVWFNKK